LATLLIPTIKDASKTVLIFEIFEEENKNLLRRKFEKN
jgi:hypothetical protein